MLLAFWQKALKLNFCSLLTQPSEFYLFLCAFVLLMIEDGITELDQSLNPVTLLEI